MSYISIYKAIEVQEVKMVNWNVKSFVCMCGEGNPNAAFLHEW